MAAGVQEPQVPAGDDPVQTSKHALHQPGEDQVQLLDTIRANPTLKTCYYLIINSFPVSPLSVSKGTKAAEMSPSQPGSPFTVGHR